MTTITAVVGWLQFTNMGIGLGLQNPHRGMAKRNKQAQKELISTAFFSLCAIGLILFVFGLVPFPILRGLASFRRQLAFYRRDSRTVLSFSSVRC